MGSNGASQTDSSGSLLFSGWRATAAIQIMARRWQRQDGFQVGSLPINVDYAVLGLELQRQLARLDKVISILEEMNLRDQTEVPREIAVLHVVAGLADPVELEPTVLIPRALDKQRLLRLRPRSVGRARARQQP